MLGSVLLSAAVLTLPSPSVCYTTDETRSTGGPTLHGDIDGDRRADAVWTEAEWLDSRHCRAFVLVRTAKTTLRAEIVSEFALFAPPGLSGLIRLDRRPGLEIAVVPNVGASTTFVAVYGLRARGLVALEGPLFGHGGSVGNRSGVDCVRRRGAVLVSTFASFRLASRRYRVERRFYGLRDDRFTLRFTERDRVRVNGLLRFPELANEIQPFPSCTAVS